MIDKLGDKLGDGLSAIISSVVASCFAAGIWLVRRVLTNEKQIALLEAELKSRHAQREEDRQDVKELKSDIRYIRERMDATRGN